VSRRALATCLVLVPGLVVCQGPGIPDLELPSDPIAIHYRTAEESRRRADDFRDRIQERARGGAPRRSPQPGYNEVVPHVDQLRELLGDVFGEQEGDPKRYQGRLALLDPRTGEVTLAPGALRGAIPLDWSPDHRRLLFAQPQGRVFQLWQLDREDDSAHPLTHGSLSHVQGCYGADGRIVATAARRVGQTVHSVVTMSRPGGRRPFEQISAGPVDHSPTCAPESGAVAWVAEPRPGRPEVYARLPGESARRVSPGRDPTFTSDGSWLLFSARSGRDWRLWRVRGDLSGRSRVGSGVRDEFRPAVSPDGRFVTYVASEELPKRHLYLRRFDGSGDRILFSDGDAEHPVW